MAKDYKLSITIQGKDKASPVLGRVGSGLAKLAKTAAIAGTVAVGALAGIGVGIAKLAIDAAPLEGIGMAFDKMAERADLSLDDLRKASAGTISDFELMRKANIALTGAGDELGKEFGQKLPYLLEIARAASRATGKDVDFLFESLVGGIKRGSPLLIDNTGLVLKLGEANEAMAAKLGKSVEELTAEEKSIALLNATVAAGQSMVEEFGGGNLTAAEQIAQFRASIQNAKDQIGLAFLPALQAILIPLAELAQKWGPRVVEWAQSAGEWLGEKLPSAFQSVSEAGSGLGSVMAVIQSVADVVVNQAFPALQAAFANLTEALNKLGLDWSDVFGALLQATGIVVVSLIAVLTGIVTAIANVAEHVSSVLIDMAQTFKLALESIARIVGGAMAIIRGIFTGDFDLIMAGARAFNEGVVGIISAMGQAIIQLFNLTLGTVIAAVSGFISGVIGFFTNLKEALVGGSIVPEMMDLMISAISAGVSAILGLFSDMVSRVIDVVSGLGDALYDVGSSVMESLRSGIESKIGEILSAIKDAINAIIQEARDALNMLSPSGVFMDIGKGMMEGMALGISGSAGLPAMAAVGATMNVTRSVTNNLTMNVYTRATTPTVIQDFETMRALAG